jgi:hypothetical protein
VQERPLRAREVSDVSAATGETTDMAGERRAHATSLQLFISLPHHSFRSSVFFAWNSGLIHCAIV